VDVTREKQVTPHSTNLVLPYHSSAFVLLTVSILPTVSLPCHNALNPSGSPFRVKRTMILQTHQNTFLSFHSGAAEASGLLGYDVALRGKLNPTI
jgi:hypothetical protein